MPEIIILKTCYKCKQAKPTTDFYKTNQRKDGLRTYCNYCFRQKAAIYKGKNPETIKAVIIKQSGNKKTIFAKANKEFNEKAKVKGSKQYYTQKWKGLLMSAKKRGFEFSLKTSDVKDLYSNADKPCPYCKQPIDKPSVDRKDNALGYIPDNCILVCLPCNILKVNVSKEQIKQIYLHLFGDNKTSQI